MVLDALLQLCRASLIEALSEEQTGLNGLARNPNAGEITISASHMSRGECLNFVIVTFNRAMLSSGADSSIIHRVCKRPSEVRNCCISELNLFASFTSLLAVSPQPSDLRI